MKKRILSLLCTLILCLGLTISAFASESSTITIVQENLSPGYYLCAIWDGEELLRMFDYTVGADGKLHTTIPVGKALDKDQTVKVGISSSNTADQKPVVVQNIKPNDIKSEIIKFDELKEILTVNLPTGRKVQHIICSFEDAQGRMIKCQSRSINDQSKNPLEIESKNSAAFAKVKVFSLDGQWRPVYKVQELLI